MGKRTRMQVKQEEEEAEGQDVRPHTRSRSTRAAGWTGPAMRKEGPSSPERKLARQSLPSPSPSSRSLRSSRSGSGSKAAEWTQTKKAVGEGGLLLQGRKLKTYSRYSKRSPFPGFGHPTAAECELAVQILSGLHGPRQRPTALVAPSTSAGCGNCPSVLDALVRTILSQNTSDANSSRAKLSMDRVYGRSDDWEAIVRGGRAKLEGAIRCGGLAAVKSKVIIDILEQVHARYGRYGLEHLHDASTDDAYRDILAFPGVGPKTASCVLLFCLGRESFAVDTHVWRIAGLLGWRPPHAGREATHAHLDATVPDHHKYPLHVLMVAHGKTCDECKAGGKNAGMCELRRAFGLGKEKKKNERDRLGG